LTDQLKYVRAEKQRPIAYRAEGQALLSQPHFVPRAGHILQSGETSISGRMPTTLKKSSWSDTYLEERTSLKLRNIMR